ncbi:hypothetical protein NDU88_003806 [Pleurodeles waltl]|uniref:Uncharacterized protein n=1 Tax=Pleurodeles waltl TaxID=8319 RepID=A0AAV7NKC6_PLEWA|nr:hypothetical protein NDU88_003806 [Pleurodeles waltl]
MSEDHAILHQGQGNRLAARSASQHKPPLPAGGQGSCRRIAGPPREQRGRSAARSTSYRKSPHRDRTGITPGAEGQIGGLVPSYPQRGPAGSCRRIADCPRCREADERPSLVRQRGKLPQAATDHRLLFGGCLPVGGHLHAHKKLQKEITYRSYCSSCTVLCSLCI